jgi:hypothetical protein
MANPSKKKIPVKPILKARVCCKSCFDKGRKDPWLRRLFVVWAASPPQPQEGASPELPVFEIAQSDGRLKQEGYLSPLTAEVWRHEENYLDGEGR